MYLLYAGNYLELQARTQLFNEHMEPALVALEKFDQLHQVSAKIPALGQYLDVCRWPFRRLEYSFVLDILLRNAQPNSMFLDAGSGVTPFAHAMAKCGFRANACDFDVRDIEALVALDPERIYGSPVRYSVQDLTHMGYADDTFEAISCVSVLEHIAPPNDQLAIGELKRILRPGGTLVITVDFLPASAEPNRQRFTYFARRLTQLLQDGDITQLYQAVGRKLSAKRAVSVGLSQVARSANQCFEASHLEQDILPLLSGNGKIDDAPFSTDLTSVSAEQARNFWRIETDSFDHNGQREVLPVAIVWRKPL